MAKPPTKGSRTSNREPVVHHLHIPINEEERDMLQTVATSEGMTYSETIRRALREYVRGRRG